MRQVQDLLDRRAARDVVGRDRELDLLLRFTRSDGPVVAFLHGIPGIGKSALLRAFASRAEDSGARVIRLDGHAVEPSEPGFLEHLGGRLGTDAGRLSAVAERLGEGDGHPVLVVDTYERLRLLDSWFRRAFVPALPASARLVLASRYPPSSRWFTGVGWQDLVLPVRLGPLPDEVAHELLEGMGLEPTAARRIQAFARGHPLALKLAAATALEEGQPSFGRADISRVVHELSRRFLEGVDDPACREALIAASVVRRATVSLLEAIFPDRDARSLHESLAELPFVYAGPDGLVVHDAVREAIARETRAADPDRHRRHRRAAWERLRTEVGDAGRSELWRYTADMLYLIENPIVREAFFPSGAQELSAEPAGERQGEAIMEIVARHEGPEAVDLIRYWWRVRRHRFRVIQAPDGSVVGFYLMFPADEGRAAPQDPVTEAWSEHLRRAGPEPPRTLFIRRWLSREDGEVPSPVQAACWLDIKRTYMEMRPELRRVYLALRDLGPYAEAAEELGFQYAPELDQVVDGAVYRTAWLDFGPDSVDGWLRRLAAAELGIEAEPPGLLDHDARELIVGDRRVPLTPRELGVLAHLERHLGEAVSRRELLEAVWRDADVASNVVDSVVYALRRKLGEHGERLETVRGFGYRLSRN